jgi:DNA-binding NarL/FixJ family response regulator
MTRVFLVDDHEIVRRGIAELIDRESDLEVVGEAGTVRDALGRVAATRPDVVVLDVPMGAASTSAGRSVPRTRTCPV